LRLVWRVVVQEKRRTCINLHPQLQPTRQPPQPPTNPCLTNSTNRTGPPPSPSPHPNHQYPQGAALPHRGVQLRRAGDRRARQAHAGGCAGSVLLRGGSGARVQVRSRACHSGIDCLGLGDVV